jgi:hypothetical protein
MIAAADFIFLNVTNGKEAAGNNVRGHCTVGKEINDLKWKREKGTTQFSKSPEATARATGTAKKAKGRREEEAGHKRERDGRSRHGRVNPRDRSLLNCLSAKSHS